MRRLDVLMVLGAVLVAASLGRAADDHERAMATFRDGQAAETRQDYPAAIRCYGEAADRLRALGDRLWEALARYRQGQALSSAGRLAEAQQATEAALAIFRALPQRDGEAAALQHLGQVHERLGRYEQALAAYQESEQILRAIGDRQGEARALHNQGNVYVYLDRYGEALDAYQRALGIKRELGDRPGEAASLHGLGNAYERLARYEEALVAYRQSLVLKHEIGDRAGEAASLHGLGNVYSKLSRFDEALGAYQQAFALQQALADRRGQAAALYGLGNVYCRLNRYDEALTCFQAALRFQRELGDRRDEAAAHHGLGNVYADLGRYPEALAAYQKSLALKRDLGDRQGAAATLHGLGNTMLCLGRLDEALAAYTEALRIHREVGDRHGAAAALHGLGNVQQEAGRYAEARLAYQQSLRITRGLGDRAGEAVTLDNLMFAWQQQGLPRLAAFYGKQAVALQHSLRGDVRGLPRELRKGLLKQQEDAHTALAACLLGLSRPAEALQILDLGRDEDLFVHAGRRGPRPARTVALTGLETHWAGRLNALAERLRELDDEHARLAASRSRDGAAAAGLAALEPRLRAAEAAYERSLSDLQAAFAGPAPLAEPVEPAECAQFRRLLGQLPSGTVAVYTATAGRELWALLVGADGYRATVTRVERRAVNAKVRAFRAAVSDPRRLTRGAGQALYQLLVAPLEPALRQAGAETILWSLDGQLRYVPVSALWDGERYLVERFRDARITPLSKERLADAPAATWTGAGFGVTRAHPPFGALPFVGDELQGVIGPAVPGASRLDDQFTAASLRAALALHPQVVHIATHYVAGPSAAESKLLLGDGTTLSLADLAQWPEAFAGAELVVLSACETAISREDSNGVEVDALGALVQQQGARAVLASLWPVADTSTSTLMCEFYRRSRGQPALMKGEALRQAQLALMRGDGGPGAARSSRFAHPYYWAPFVLTGNFR